jgi:hypothetical protein
MGPRRVSCSLFLAALAACGGRSDLFVPTAAAQAPPPSDPAIGVSCQECLEPLCVDFFVQCAEGPECAATLACVQAHESADECLCEHNQGAPAFVALADCMRQYACGATECSGACEGEPGRLPCDAQTSTSACFVRPLGDGSVESVSACDACVSTMCGDLATSCAPGTACDEYTSCVAECDSVSCAVACDTPHPGGRQAAEALDVCLGAACSEQCD